MMQTVIKSFSDLLEENKKDERDAELKVLNDARGYINAVLKGTLAKLSLGKTVQINVGDMELAIRVSSGTLSDAFLDLLVEEINSKPDLQAERPFRKSGKRANLILVTKKE